MNNKEKLIRILQILKDTDIDHPINTTGIIAKLKGFGIEAERKSVMRDIETLSSMTEVDFEIEKAANGRDGWYMGRRAFEDYELKLFADYIASGKYLDEKNSGEIIDKIIDHATPTGKELIRRSVISDKSQKINGTHFLDYFSLIIQAIKEKKKLTFKYFEFKGNELVHKRDGHVYTVSPYYTVLYDNEYFLIANTEGHENATHYRIELMDQVDILDEEKCRPITEIKALSINGKAVPIEEYLRSSVNLWTGELINVRLHCSDSCRLEIVKHFGRSWISENFDGTFDISVDVTNNMGFYKFLAQMGTDVKIISPDSVRERYKEYLRSALEQYED